jgi:2,3-bisphosphoglycerate-independent phosphoglycerate mutase
LKPDAKKTADVVNKLMVTVNTLLSGLDMNKEREKRGLPPANAILLRGPGLHSEIQTLKDRYGISSVVIAGGALYIGTAKYVGMVHETVEGQTGTIDTNFHNIATKVIECIEGDYDYIFVHIKATDNASHDNNAKEKMLAIEQTDTLVGKIIDKVGSKIVLVVTGDHTTSVSTGEHTCDPVPIVLWSEFVRPDQAEMFSEIDAALGGLHTIRGLDVMPLLLGYSGHIEKFGA